MLVLIRFTALILDTRFINKQKQVRKVRSTQDQSLKWAF